MIALVRAGRTLEELAEEFEPSPYSIRNWVRQADLDRGVRTDGLTSEVREELRRQRRESKQPRHGASVMQGGRRGPRRVDLGPAGGYLRRSQS